MEKSELKLWSLGGEVAEKTDALSDVRNRLNAVFKQSTVADRHTVSAEYWHQVEN